jgi:hypothetical protein
MTAALNMQITRGSLKMCEPCAVAKARQMNVSSKSEGSKTEKFNGCMYHDIVIVKESNNDKKLGRKSVWRVIAEETVNFKMSKFFLSKSEMLIYMCEYMESEKVQDHPIAIIRQDNAGENKKLVMLAHSKDWKHENLQGTQDSTAKLICRVGIHGASGKSKINAKCSTSSKR